MTVQQARDLMARQLAEMSLEELRLRASAVGIEPEKLAMASHASQV